MREISRIFVHHSASDAGRHTWAEIKEWHTRPKSEGGKHGWSDIGYHWGIVFDGGEFKCVLGRPIHIQGAHVKGHNTDSIGICVEGNFEEEPPHGRQIYLLVSLLSDLCRTYKISPVHVLGHCEAPYATACPGRYFPINAVRGRLMDIARRQM